MLLCIFSSLIVSVNIILWYIYCYQLRFCEQCDQCNIIFSCLIYLISLCCLFRSLLFCSLSLSLNRVCSSCP
jgi:hypothetical protein